MISVMSAARAQEIAATFDLRALPPDFYTSPYPVYDVLRHSSPIHRMPDGSYFLTRHADLVAVYRDAQSFSSDKKVEFEPKYGAASALFEHHTTNLEWIGIWLNTNTVTTTDNISQICEWK